MDGKFFDGLYEGDSANGVKLCMGLTGGDFWARIEGCQNLYRGGSMEKIDFDNVMAISEIADGTISPPVWLEHSSSATYFYVVRRANCCGVEEYTFGGSVKVSFDSQGDLIQPGCNSVFNIKALQVFGDKVLLIWFYQPVDQGAGPSCFRIYSDDGGDEIDYENAAAEIDYGGRRFYNWQSGVLNGDKYLFCIRAVSTEGVEDDFLGQIRIHLNKTKPEAVEILEGDVI